MATILLTGGAGAIGSRTAAALLQDGHSVVILDDLSSGRRDLVPADARFVQGSVESEEDLEKAFAAGPEYVVHLAALFANQNSVEHPRRDLMVNGMGTLKTLEQCRDSGVRKTVYISSSCVYGMKELAVETDELFDVKTPYAMTKLLGERYCRFFVERHELDVVTARLFNNYGPGEYPGRYRNVIPNFVDLALRGEPLPITGDGSETRDFNFVDDTVSGVVGMLFAETEPGDVFNIAHGRDVPILDVAEKINALTGNAAGVEFKPRRSWDHVLRRRASIEKARTALGYEPAVDLDEGLERTCDWIRSIRG